MSQLKRSVLITILTVSMFLVSFIAAFINSHVIVALLMIIVISTSFIIARLILQSREEHVSTIVQTILNNRKKF
ncbi:hypothetical protein [Priestia megaterium]|uniref:hypothetical protein n=1 Tax=Priestia megaterium TaxID=1404 RepID=UPI002E1F46B7|nr:hypothetical protein [Priestia megaterium]